MSKWWDVNKHRDRDLRLPKFHLSRPMWRVALYPSGQWHGFRMLHEPEWDAYRLAWCSWVVTE